MNGWLLAAFVVLVFIAGAAFGVWLQCWCIRRADEA